MASLLPRRVVGATITFLLTLVSVSAFAAPAQAEEGYQYWNYFHLEGETWAFSEVGPADYQPEDGDVEGFRYGTSTTSQGIEPRADLAEVNFDTICADTEAADGEKRVGVVLDYGVELGSGAPPEPRAECAVVPADASTQDILGEVTEPRVEGGMTCALDGYPASGCGEPVKDADVPTEEEPVAFALASDSAEDSGTTDADTTDAGTTDAAADEAEDGTPLGPVVIVALVVVLIAVAALLLSRRNKRA